MRKKVKKHDNITTIMLVEDEEINLRLMEGCWDIWVIK